MLVFEKVGIPYAADIFNFVILDGYSFCSELRVICLRRMLWSLSNERTLPACFARVTKNGAMTTALSVSMLGGGAGAVFQRGGPGHGICCAVGNLRFAVVAVWLSICASHLFFVAVICNK
ncbi:hypothetical protein [Escherichia coli]|uniref:hypothetical protein n=1 Tax=Escherichia coli TaxID=562 RepID=UPI00223568BE|nr:hypothetical protein [Escherichia coli]